MIIVSYYPRPLAVLEMPRKQSLDAKMCPVKSFKINTMCHYKGTASINLLSSEISLYGPPWMSSKAFSVFAQFDERGSNVRFDFVQRVVDFC